uniref:Ovate family protein n=1 Tax=Loa loa TaxID=7209 RepID=A0A1I7VWL7_LOALO
MSMLIPNSRAKLKMDDNLADYRRFCANRLKRLERCKKTKSFCNLDDEVPYPFGSTGSDLILMGTEKFASHDGSITFSRCSENAVFSSIRNQHILLRIKDSSNNRYPRSGSAGVFSLNVLPSISEANPAKSSPTANSWLDNSGKYTSVTSNFGETDNRGNNSRHLPPSSCWSSYSSLTTALSTVSSQSSMLSAKKPELVKRTTMTCVNNDDDCNQKAQRNFDLLREKMVKFAVFHDFEHILNFSIIINRNKNLTKVSVKIYERFFSLLILLRSNAKE